MVWTFKGPTAFPADAEVVRSMALKPATATIVDFETTFDAVPIPSAAGDVIWAEVRIEYRLSGLAPTLTIRVPMPWKAQETPDERKTKALRCARQLIDHACLAAGMESVETETEGNMVEEVLHAVTPPRLEGIAQELGLANPMRGPRRQRGQRPMPSKEQSD
jgi:hypothetical protein